MTDSIFYSIETFVKYSSFNFVFIFFTGISSLTFLFCSIRTSWILFFSTNSSSGIVVHSSKCFISWASIILANIRTINKLLNRILWWWGVSSNLVYLDKRFCNHCCSKCPILLFFLVVDKFLASWLIPIHTNFYMDKFCHLIQLRYLLRNFLPRSWLELLDDWYLTILGKSYRNICFHLWTIQHLLMRCVHHCLW